MKTINLDQALVNENLRRIQPIVREVLNQVPHDTFIALSNHGSTPQEFIHARDTVADALARAIVEAQSELIQGPPLENYQGYIIVKIQPCSQSVIEPGSICNLVITFCPDAQSPEDGAFIGNISIQDGVDKEQVEFDLAFDKDCDEVKNPFLRSTDCQPNGTIKVLVKAGKKKELRFPFTTPTSIGKFNAWIQVFQKYSLIQVVPIEIVTTE